MKSRLLLVSLLILFSTQFLFAQTNLIAGVEAGVASVIQPLNNQAACDTIFSFPSVDEIPAGITSDGNVLWCISGNSNYIYQYDFTGLLMDSIFNPASVYGAYGGDLEFDGTNLLVMVEQVDTLYKINPNTGTVVSRFKVAPCMQNCYGVTFDGTYIWVTNYSPSFIYKLNAITGAVINTFPTSSPSYMLPIKFINGKLYGLSMFPGMLHEIDTLSGNILSTGPWCLGYPLGFCKINNHIWGVSSQITNGGTQRIYQFDSLFVTNLPFYQPEKVSLELFPNPSKGNITLSFPEGIDKGTISVSNVLGEIVFVESFNKNTTKEINLKKASPGVYFVKVFDGEQYYSKKIIVEQN